MTRLLFFLFFLCCATGEARTQDKWDLRKSVEYALANNISVRQQDVQARLSDLLLKQSRLSQYPSLNFGNTLGLNTGRSIDRTTNQFTTETIFYTGFSLQTNVDIFNFFSKRYTIEANRYEAEATRASVDRVKNDIALNVAGAYLQILLNREQVTISSVQIQQTIAQLTNTRKLVAAGSVPELNALELEAQLARDSSNLVTARGNELQSIYALKALLNVDAAAPFDVIMPPVESIPVEPLSELLPENVYGLALKNLPLQRVNSLRLLSAQKSVAAARGAMYPSVSLGASIQTNYSNLKNQAQLTGTSINGFNPIGIVKGTADTVLAPNIFPNYRFYANPFGAQFTDNFSNGIGINISVPIFNGGSARTAWKRAQLNVENYELLQQQDNQNLKQDIYQAHTDAVTSIQKFNAATKSVETAQRAFDIASRRYNVGLLNTIEFLTSQSNLYRARIERSVAQFDYVFKLKVLEFYRGQGLRLE